MHRSGCFACLLLLLLWWGRCTRKFIFSLLELLKYFNLKVNETIIIKKRKIEWMVHDINGFLNVFMELFVLESLAVFIEQHWLTWHLILVLFWSKRHSWLDIRHIGTILEHAMKKEMSTILILYRQKNYFVWFLSSNQHLTFLTTPDPEIIVWLSMSFHLLYCFVSSAPRSFHAQALKNTDYLVFSWLLLERAYESALF